MNIIRHEFRMKRKSALIWSLGITALLLVYLAVYPTFADEAALMNQVMESFPPEFRAAFGLDKADLSTVLGYYSGLLFLFVQLCLAIQAANYGFGLVTIEEAERTADFLLSKPITRVQVLSGKLAAAFAALTITNLVVWIDSFLFINLFRGDREYDPAALALLLSAIVFFQLFFLSVGLVISLLVKRVRNVTPYALGLSFGAYVLAAFSGIWGDVKLEYITPFKHFDPASIVQNGAYDAPLVLLNVTVSIVALALSYRLYVRRDIPSVA